MRILTDILYNHKKLNRENLDYNAMQEIFVSKINDGVPFFAGRLGLTEAYNMRAYEFGYRFRYDKAMEQLCTWSGFFPNDSRLLERYCKLMRECLQQIDFIHPFGSKGENYLIEKYCPVNTALIPNPTCWTSENPFTSALEGKRVLVIHPFADSIVNQYEKRTELFPNMPAMLPEFELHTIKAVQTIAGEQDDRFKDWFEAVNWMCQETTKVDYDVALIGCGAYGFPLAAFCKQRGKIAIHMGGDLQMQFGIIGARWDDHPWVKKNVNEAWIRPSEFERPQNADAVETECYW